MNWQVKQTLHLLKRKVELADKPCVLNLGCNNIKYIPTVEFRMCNTADDRPIIPALTSKSD